MNRVERAVMDHWDAGLSKKQIAAAMPEASSRAIERAVSCYGQEWDDSRRFERMVRTGDALYQAALAAAGGSYR